MKRKTSIILIVTQGLGLRRNIWEGVPWLVGQSVSQSVSRYKVAFVWLRTRSFWLWRCLSAVVSAFDHKIASIRES